MAGPIKALQHMFTSSRRFGGFRTIAYSEGLSSEEVQKLEELVTYPIDIGIQNDRPPEIYRYIKLNNERFAFSRSVFVPRDFAGRPGNYFSHSLVINLNDIHQAFSSPNLIFSLPEIFVDHYDEETSRLPPKEIALSGDARITFDRVSGELLAKLPFILEALLRTFKNERPSSVFVVVKEYSDIFSILSAVFNLLPPGLSFEVTFTTFVLSPTREFSNYRLMFSLREYQPRIPSSQDMVTFNMADNSADTVNTIDALSTWSRLIGNYIQHQSWAKIEELINLHRRYGKENPLEMAELLARLAAFEEEFYEGKNEFGHSAVNAILSAVNPEVKIELLQSRREIFNTLLQRKAYQIYISLLHLLNSQPEMEVRRICTQQLETLIEEPDFFLLTRDIHNGIELIVNMIPLALTNAQAKKFVFDSLSGLIERGVVERIPTFKNSLRPLWAESDPMIISAIEEFFFGIVKKFKERVDMAQHILDIFIDSGLPIRKTGEVLDILSTDFNPKIYVGWIAALTQFLSENGKIAVVERAIRQCIDRELPISAAECLRPLLSSLSLKSCAAIKRNIEGAYNKGKRLRGASAKSFLFFGRRHPREQTAAEIKYNEFMKTLQEYMMVKGNQKNQRQNA